MRGQIKVAQRHPTDCGECMLGRGPALPLLSLRLSRPYRLRLNRVKANPHQLAALPSRSSRVRASVFGQLQARGVMEGER